MDTANAANAGPSPSYQWKKINESQYVSRFEDYLLIEWQQTGTEFSFTLIKTAWTRELYNMMKEN